MKNLSPKDKKGIALIAVVVIVMTSLGITALVLSPKPYDKTTFCLTEDPYDKTVIVLDQTDSRAGITKHGIITEINRIKDNLRKNERLTILTIDSNKERLLNPVFDMCSPGTGKDANPLYKNPELIRRRFDKFFSKPLEDVLDTLFTEEEAPTSPLFEAVGRAAYIFNEDNSKDKRLIFFTDLLHNTDYFSFYRKNGASGEKLFESEYRNIPIAELNDVQVDVFLFKAQSRTLDRKEEASLIAFWDAYFTTSGASLNSIKRVM